MERSCAATQSHVFLAPQGSLDAVFAVGSSLMLPADVSLPSTFTVRGLTVRVLAGSDARHCLDASQEMVDKLASARPAFPPEALQNVAPGVWLLKTQPDGVPAPVGLTSDAFLRELGPKSLVAFAPEDHVVALADASNPAAIRAAAKHLVAAVDVDSTETYTEAAPLLLKDGVWTRWQSKDAARELRDVRKLGEILEARMVLSELDGFTTYAQWASEPPLGLGVVPDVSMPDGVVSQLEVADGLATSVRVEPWNVTFIAQADTVVVGSSAKPMPWDTFQKKHADALQPIYVNGVLMPRVLRWAP